MVNAGEAADDNVTYEDYMERGVVSDDPGLALAERPIIKRPTKIESGRAVGCVSPGLTL